MDDKVLKIKVTAEAWEIARQNYPNAPTHYVTIIENAMLKGIDLLLKLQRSEQMEKQTTDNTPNKDEGYLFRNPCGEPTALAPDSIAAIRKEIAKAKLLYAVSEITRQLIESPKMEAIIPDSVIQQLGVPSESIELVGKYFKDAGWHVKHDKVVGIKRTIITP